MPEAPTEGKACAEIARIAGAAVWNCVRRIAGEDQPRAAAVAAALQQRIEIADFALSLHPGRSPTGKAADDSSVGRPSDSAHRHGRHRVKRRHLRSR